MARLTPLVGCQGIPENKTLMLFLTYFKIDWLLFFRRSGSKLLDFTSGLKSDISGGLVEGPITNEQEDLFAAPVG